MSRYPPPLEHRFAAMVHGLAERLQALEARTAPVTPSDRLYARYGTVDPSYAGGDPQVTVDGDAGLTGPYPYLRPYAPVAGDYVLLVPTGGTYAVAGTTTGPAEADVLCVAYTDGAQTTGHGFWAAMPCGGEDIDTAGMHSTASNTHKFTPPYPGWYEMSGWAVIAASAAGTARQVSVMKNGGEVTFYGFHRTTHFTAGLDCIIGCTSVPVWCNGTSDYLTFGVWQNSGGPLGLGVSRVKVRRVRRP